MKSQQTYYSKKEAAKVLGYAKTTFDRMRTKREIILKPYKEGCRVFFFKEDVERLKHDREQDQISERHELMHRRCKEEGCMNKGAMNHKPWKTDPYKGERPRKYLCSTHIKKKYNSGSWAYKQYRKDYCENIDGRLGFKCTTTIVSVEYQLEVDHIDNDHDNNNLDNYQTLCSCCHRIKTKFDNENDTKALDLMNKIRLNTNKI